MNRKKAQTEQSASSDDDSEEEKAKIDWNRPKVDRILKDTTSLKRIAINVSMTQYPVVSQVAKELGWRIQTDPSAGDWDIFWTDFSIEPDILIRMHFHQKINHYPGIYVIARKNLLGLNLMGMRSRFPEEYNFFPLTWMLPSQYSQFRMYYESVTKGKVRTYIVKPEAECQGRGIFLTRNIQDLENGRHYVIQRYVNKPYLIDGLKFDLRIYVLLAGTDPLRVYIFQQGLARFATEPYTQPNATNLDQTFIHLTNYAINKLNPKFVFNKSVNDMSTGHKRSLTSVYKYLQRKGENVALLKQKINQAIIKTLLTSNPLMSHQYRYSQPQQYSGNMCFHILGFDILITQQFEPLLLQVNHTPSFTTDTPLDTFIKHKLIRDTLVLMNINTKTKASLFAKAKQYNVDRLRTGKRQIYQGEVKQKEVDMAQLARDQYEDQHLGGFTKIHPVEDQEQQKKYNQILEHATKVYQEENTLRARMEEKEAKKMLKEERKMFKLQMKAIEDEEKTKVIDKAQATKPSSSQPSKKLNLSHKNTSKKVTKLYSHKRIVQVRKDSNSRADSSNNQSDTNPNKHPSTHQQSQISQMIKVTKQSIKDLHKSGLQAKYLSINNRNSRGKLRNRCSEIIDLPYIPSEQKQISRGMPISQSELIEKEQELGLNLKKAVSYKETIKDQKDQKIRISKIRKLQEDIKTLNRSNMKTGNFVMPKIFDINLQVSLYEERQNERRGMAYLSRFEQ